MVTHTGVTISATTAEVVDAAFAGFETWYVCEHPKVVAALTWVAGDPHVAADATDEAFAQAYADWRRVGRMARRIDGSGSALRRRDLRLTGRPIRPE